MAKPKPVTENEIALRKRARRRLVGAIALVLVVAVVLPWVVDDDPPPRLKNVDIAIPAVESVDRKFPSTPPVGEPIPAPAAPARSETPGPTADPAAAPAAPKALEAPSAEPRPVDPVATPSAQSTTPPSATPSSGADTASPKPVAPKPEAKVEAKPAATPEAKPTAKAEPKADAKPDARAPAGKGFVMQVGAFSSADKAKQLQLQLRAAGFPAYLESVKTASGERTRVRAGPFATVEAAQKARIRLLGLKVAQGDLKVVPREN